MPLFQTSAGMVLFAHIPKCGGMSIEKAFSKYPTHLKNPFLHGKNQLGFPCSPQHFHAEIFEKLWCVDSLAFSFAIVRNPLDRILSEYKFRKDIANRQSREIDHFDKWLDVTLTKYSDDSYILDNHIRPQADFLLPKMNIFKFEDGIQKALEKVVSQHGHLDIEIGAHVNRSVSLQPEFSASSASMIKEFYQTDYSQFEYQ